MIKKVVIICSVYNSESTLEDMIESVINQTFYDFDLCIVDDGSTDRTPVILKEISNLEPRIKVISRSNHGLTPSLRYAINMTESEYIARIDADDTWEPTKLEKQVEYLERNTRCSLLGTAFDEFFDSQKNKIENDREIECSHNDITDAFPFKNPFLHSSVLFRRDIYEKVGGYSKRYKYAQDYDLWGKFLRVSEGHNLPEVLCSRRYSEKMISVEKERSQRFLALRIKFSNIYLVKKWIPFFNQVVKDLLVITLPKKVIDLIRRGA